MEHSFLFPERGFGRDRSEGYGDQQRSRAGCNNGRSRFIEQTVGQTIQRSIGGRVAEKHSFGKLRGNLQKTLVHGYGAREMRVGGRIGDGTRDPEASAP